MACARTKTALMFLAGMAMPFAVTAAALADGMDPARAVAPAEPWSLHATPYGWLPFLDGDVTVAARTTNLNVNPIQVLEHLERVPWMSYVEARKGPLVLYNDIFYANLGSVGSGTATFGQVATLNASLGVDFEELVVELGGAYEVARWNASAIDVLAGARYWHQDMSINLALTATLALNGLVISGNRAVAESGSIDWVDPVVGARFRHHLAPGQDLMLRADVGGFGAGSKFSWNAVAAYSWEIAVRDGVTYSGVLGYRALDVDYEQGTGINRYVYDVLQHGPITGLTIGF
jgi:hypothetical protein